MIILYLISDTEKDNLNCPTCKDPLWNPFTKCEQCGYSIKFTLENPSPYQATQKWPKHGLLYDGTKTIVDPSAWGKIPGTKFITTVDITKAFETVAASGNMVIPKDSGRDESYIFYIVTLTGGGALEGHWQDFYAIRLVKPGDPDKIHIFPDNVRSVADKEVVCGRCDRSHIVSKRPEFCPCGNRLRW